MVCWSRYAEPTSVDLTPSSHHQPPGASPRLFCVFDFFTTRNVSERSPRQQPSSPPSACHQTNQELRTKHKKQSQTTTPSAARAQKLRKLHRVCWWFRPGTLFRLRKATLNIQPGQSHGNDSAYADQINSPIRVFPRLLGVVQMPALVKHSRRAKVSAD